MVLTYTSILLLACFSSLVVASFCPETQYLNAKLQICMNCTKCKANMVVLRPCEIHRDTHCAPFSELLKTMETGNPHRHKHQQHHHQKPPKEEGELIWRFGDDVRGNTRDARVNSGNSGRDEPKAAASEVASSEAPFSSTETLVWDWQAIALTSAVFSCILFFLVITLYSLHQARQWRRLKENFEADPTFALQYYKLAKTAFSKDCEPQFSSLWKSSKNPTEEDHLATLELLSLRKILHSEFEDKKTHKNELWTKVAKEMNAKGFYVGSEVAEGREKVRQKFANLQKCYIKYFDTQRSTGEGKLVKPKYFDELDEILGDKHKVNPVKIIDSSSNKSDLADENKPSVSHCNVTKSDTVDSHASTCSGGRFQQVKKRLRPVSEKNTILKELVSIEKEKQQERKEEFARMMEMFNTQNEQRHTQMMAMINTMNKKQKRKHHSSSSENVEELSARLGLMAASNSEHELLKEAGLSPSSPPDANYLNSKCLYLEQLLSERKEGDKVRTLPRGNVYIEESNSKGQ